MYEAIQRAKQGDTAAKEYVVSQNVGLVWSIVRRFLNRGHEPDDLFQTGCIGLIKAIEKFDEGYGVKFSTYAVPMIMGEIKRHIRDDGIIKVSRSIKETAIKVKTAMDKISHELGREPTILEISAKTGISTEDIVMSLDAVTTPESINAEITEDGRSMENAISDGADMECEVVNRLAIKEALHSLGARERQIIVMRYFGDCTQSQIAQRLGISQVQVSRIEKRVLLKMRDKMTI